MDSLGGGGGGGGSAFDGESTFNNMVRSGFDIDDIGNFQLGVFHGQSSKSSYFYGMVIGRSRNQPTGLKTSFTPSDIVEQGYMYKRGSWIKNWKKRYFVLRSDIKALCYYASKDSMELLGSVMLTPQTLCLIVDPKDAENYNNVFAVKQHAEAKLSDSLFCRVEDPIECGKWMMYIMNESQDCGEVVTEDFQTHWWNALFDGTKIVDGGSSAPRRGNLLTQSSVSAITSPKSALSSTTSGQA